MTAVFVKRCAPPPFDRAAVYRYMGAAGLKDAAVDALVDVCLAECGIGNETGTEAGTETGIRTTGTAKAVFSYQAAYCVLPVRVSEKAVSSSALSFESRALAKHLQGCGAMLVFAATVGIGIDRLIAKYTKLNTAKALAFESIGTERIESLCDAFCQEMEGFCGKLRPRFSPGYGDLSIETQKEIFGLLDCPKKLGLTLCDSMLMSPSKSVTAVVGIENGSVEGSV